MFASRLGALEAFFRRDRRQGSFLSNYRTEEEKVVKHKLTQSISMKFGDAELIKTGTARFDIRDPYTIAITVTWSSFFLLLFLIELLLNTAFAILYALDSGCLTSAKPGSFIDGFFFSIETLATVGYGTVAPANLYGHIVSAIEILCGLIFTAIITGLIFVRFSKPRPNILFADQAVIAKHNGIPTLMIRVANGRRTAMAGAAAELAVFKPTISSEGRGFRQVHELKLIRDTMPLFMLTWTVMHVINEDSPLYGLDLDTLSSADLIIALTIQARDHTAGEDVFDIRFYNATRILAGMAYQDAISFDEQGRPNADLSKISHVEPDAVLSG
jgi:inward rectifier potassium channel